MKENRDKKLSLSCVYYGSICVNDQKKFVLSLLFSACAFFVLYTIVTWLC